MSITSDHDAADPSIPAPVIKSDRDDDFDNKAVSTPPSQKINTVTPKKTNTAAPTTYAFLDVRGTMIKVPCYKLCRSPVIAAWIKKENAEDNLTKSLYIDRKPDDIHNLLEYLAGRKHVDNDTFADIIGEFKFDANKYDSIFSDFYDIMKDSADNMFVSEYYIEYIINSGDVSRIILRKFVEKLKQIYAFVKPNDNVNGECRIVCYDANKFKQIIGRIAKEEMAKLTRYGNEISEFSAINIYVTYYDVEFLTAMFSTHCFSPHKYVFLCRKKSIANVNHKCHFQFSNDDKPDSPDYVVIKRINVPK